MSIFLLRLSKKAISITEQENERSLVEQYVPVESEVKDTIYLEYLNSNKYYVCHYFSCSNPFFKAKEQVYLKRSTDKVTSITLVNGFIWSRLKTLPINAKDVDQILQQLNDKENIRENLCGDYSIIRIDEYGNVLAFSDPLSVEHLYVAETSEAIFLTNRVALLKAYEIREPAVENLIWLPIVGYMIGEGTSIKGITRIPQGGIVKIDPNLRVDTSPTNSFLNNNKRGWLLNPNQPLLEHAIEEATQSLQIALNAGHTRIAITGGKDSRLVLALAIAGGFHDRISLFTFGDSESADVKVASLIANQFKIKHEKISPPLISKTLEDKDLLKDFAAHAYQNEGMFGLWDIKSKNQGGFGITLSGFFGEVLKSYMKKPFKLNKRFLPSSFISKHGPFDPLELLYPSSRLYFDKWLADRLTKKVNLLNMELDDIPDFFYVSERIPNWLGGARKLDSNSVQVVSPLYSPSLIKLAFYLNSDERQLELLHYLIIRKLVPDLAKIPFSDQSWKPNLKNYGATPDNFVEPIKTIPGQPRHGSWQYGLNYDSNVKEFLIKVFSSFSQSPFWDWIDQKKLLTALHDKTFNMPELISILGLISCFFWVHDIVIPRKMQLPNTLNRSLHRRIFTICHAKNTENYFLFEQALAKESFLQTAEKQNNWIEIDPYIINLYKENQDNQQQISYEGYIDTFSIEGIFGLFKGWAWCPKSPAIRLNVQVYCESRLVGEAIASLNRLDVAKTGRGDGKYGFSILCQLATITNFSKISIRVEGSDYELNRTTRFKNEFERETIKVKLPPSHRNGIKKLHVGCGPKNILEDWWNVDIRYFKGIDQVMDVTKPWPWTDRLDYVYGEHFIEHLHLEDAIKFLNHAGNALRINGKIRLSTPSLEWVIKSHFTFEDVKQIHQTLIINRAFHGWGHQFLYSKHFLRYLLESLGYTEINFFNYGESHDDELKNIENHGGFKIEFSYPNVWIVEATKTQQISPSTEFIDMVHEQFIKYVKSGH